MALSYTVILEGSTYSNSKFFKTYDDAIAEAKRLAERKPTVQYGVYQSSVIVGTPKAPIEVTPTYFDYAINVKQPTAPVVEGCSDDEMDF